MRDRATVRGRQPPPRGDVLLVSVSALRDVSDALQSRGLGTWGPIGERQIESTLKKRHFDCVVVDLRSSFGSATLKWLCSGLGCEVIVITAAADARTRIRAVQSGAADHVVAPFDCDELCTRVEAVVARHRRARRRVIEVGDIAIDASERIVRRRGATIVLTDRELALLLVLVDRREHVVAKRQLREELYPGKERSLNIIEAHLSSLRKKLQNGSPPLIHTVHGLGYTFRAVAPERPQSRRGHSDEGEDALRSTDAL